jgi:hypothetical protein
MSEEMSGESSASGPPSQLKQDWHSVRPLFAPLLSGRNLPANAKTAEHHESAARSHRAAPDSTARMTIRRGKSTPRKLNTLCGTEKPSHAYIEIFLDRRSGSDRRALGIECLSRTLQFEFACNTPFGNDAFSAYAGSAYAGTSNERSN